MRKYLLIIAMLFLFTGCITETADDGTTTKVLDPNTVANIESGVESGALIAELLAPLLGPVSYLIGGGLLTALGVWRKVKPRIMDAEGKAEVGHAVTASLVEAIEVLKREHPDKWLILKPKIDAAIAKSGMDSAVLENIIRGIRGLPPKG